LAGPKSVMGSGADRLTLLQDAECCICKDILLDAVAGARAGQDLGKDSKWACLRVISISATEPVSCSNAWGFATKCCPHVKAGLAGKCGHDYCDSCLRAWRRACTRRGVGVRCPTCRAELEEVHGGSLLCRCPVVELACCPVLAEGFGLLASLSLMPAASLGYRHLLEANFPERIAARRRAESLGATTDLLPFCSSLLFDVCGII
jgi:hypothetical protein